MIHKNQVKNLHFIDRDTDIGGLVDEIQIRQKAELITFLRGQSNRLQEKDAGEYYTIEVIAKLKDGELEKMMRFFRGAVVPYYVRQSREIWDAQLPDEIVEEATVEIKRAVGFTKYDHTGHKTDEVNSLATFERIKDFSEFLKSVEAVCFDDTGYIFPDSEHFRKLEKEKGRTVAQYQVFEELYQKVKNLSYKGEMP